jgi:hypothetical protein
VKRIENFWKGLKDNRSQISPVPPQQYGDRFLNFVTGITMTKEEAERRRAQSGNANAEVTPVGVPIGGSQRTSLNTTAGRSLDVDRTHEMLAARSPPGSPMAVEHTMAKAQKQVDRETSDKGRRRSEEEKPSRTLLTAEDGKNSALLPVVSEENGEGSRGGSRSASQSQGGRDDGANGGIDDDDGGRRRGSDEVRTGREGMEDGENEVDKELQRRGSEGIKMVETHESDCRGYEKVSVQMPNPGHGAMYDPDWNEKDQQRHRPSDPSWVKQEMRRQHSQQRAEMRRLDDREERPKPPRIGSDIIPPFSPFDAGVGFATSGDPEKR